MKLVNFDTKTLVMQNLRHDTIKEVPKTFTVAQYRILCNLIRQKPITKRFFDFLLKELYSLSDWHDLSYEQMYELIHVLTFWNYQTETEKERI